MSHIEAGEHTGKGIKRQLPSHWPGINGQWVYIKKTYYY